MKLFLDDVRKPPDDTWILCRTAAKFCRLAHHTIEGDVLSLDHDLGLDQPTGYEVMTSLEKDVALNGLWSIEGMPEIKFHSANPVGVADMERALGSIHRLLKK